jgi:hypothetical protein
MELIYSLFSLAALIKIYSSFKISFIFLLFILNIYLIITSKKEFNSSDKPVRVLQSGFNIKKLKGFLGTLGSIGGFLSVFITLKNELKNIQIGKLDQLMEAVPLARVEIRRSIDKDREEHQRLLYSIEDNRDELLKLYGEKTKVIGHNDRILTLHNSIKENVLSFKDKSIDPSAKLSDLGILDQLIKQDTKKFAAEVNYALSLVEPREDIIPLGVKDSDSSTPLAEAGTSGTIKESNMLNFDILTTLSKGIEYFETLNGIKKLAVCLILSKSVIFSALSSIIFIFYGNILIEKYDLTNKYPKLAKLIQLRQKLQNYYFKYYCILILIIIITEITFALAVLFLL